MLTTAMFPLRGIVGVASWVLFVLFLVGENPDVLVVRADPPPDPQCRVFCFRITDVRCDPTVPNRYHFEFEVLNWSDALAGGVKLVINHFSSPGIEFADPLLGGIDLDNRPLIWEDIDGDGEFEYDLGDLEDLLIPNGLLDTVGAQTEDKNGNDRLDNDPIPGNLRRPNEWVVSERLAKTMTWETGDDGVPIPFINLLGAGADPTGSGIGNCKQCIENLPQRDDGVPFNGIDITTGDVDPLEWVDNGDNVQDGFVMTLDGLEPGKAVHLNWFLTGAGDVDPAPPKVLITELMVDPNQCSDNDGEWIELYNAENHPVDITGWSLVDNTNKPLALVPGGVLQSGEYYIVSKPADGCDGQLGADQTNMGFRMNNRNGEIVTLVDDDGTLVDRVVYGFANMTDAGPTVPAGYTWERKADPHNGQPQDTTNDSPVDFRRSSQPGGTPRAGYAAPIDDDCKTSDRGNVPVGDPIGRVNNGNLYGFGLVSLVRLDDGQELPGGTVKGQTGFRQSGTEFFDGVYNVPPNDEGSCGTIGMEFTPSKTCEEEGVRGNNCRPINTNGGGDPHFTTWNGDRFSFHGECDLVLIRNPSFENGLGMHVHGRTKIHPDEGWSDMESVAVKIGNDIFEARGASEYWVNGVRNAKLPALLGGGYQVSRQVLNARRQRVVYAIAIGGAKQIRIKSFGDMMWVQVSGQQANVFWGSNGLLGHFGTGKMVGRDGKTVINLPNRFGQEWQVTPDLDPILFRSAEGPQYPHQMCKMPERATTTTKDQAIALEVAERLCARAPLEVRDDCIYDVVATQNVQVASSY